MNFDNNTNLVSLNCKGLGNRLKRKNIISELKLYEVLLLQETHTCKENEKEWIKGIPHKNAILSHGTNRARGAAILTNTKFKYDLIHEIQINTTNENLKGRIAAGVFEWQNEKLTMMSCYAPCVTSTNSTKEEYLEFLRMIEQCLEAANHYSNIIIMGGDFNIIFNELWDQLDTGGIVHTDILLRVETIFAKYNLGDIIRTRNQNTNIWTYAPLGNNAHSIFRRLDYFFISKELNEQVYDDHDEIMPFSDHKSVSIQVGPMQAPVALGNGLWRHNDSLLENAEYLKVIEESIKDAKEEGNEILDNRIKLEFVKFRIKNASRKFAIELAKTKRKEDGN